MSKLLVGTFLTLDGVMQAPGGPDEDRDGGFGHGGWLVPYFDDVLGEVMDTWIERAGSLLLGRKTYDIFAAHWPHVTEEHDDYPIARKFNSIPKYVASRTLSTADWAHTTVLSGDVAEAVAKLKEQPGGEIQVHGSGELVQTLLKHHLVDEFQLCVFPVTLGTGKRLFVEGTVPTALRLTDSRTTTTGVAIHRYERAGTPEYGSYALEQ